MEGCSAPLVVKFADTQKEKEQKRIQQIQKNLWNLPSGLNLAPLSPTTTTDVSTNILNSSTQHSSPLLTEGNVSPSSLQLIQQLQAVGLQQQLLQGNN